MLRCFFFFLLLPSFFDLFCTKHSIVLPFFFFSGLASPGWFFFLFFFFSFSFWVFFFFHIDFSSFLSLFFFSVSFAVSLRSSSFLFSQFHRVSEIRCTDGMRSERELPLVSTFFFFPNCFFFFHLLLLPKEGGKQGWYTLLLAGLALPSGSTLKRARIYLHFSCFSQAVLGLEKGEKEKRALSWHFFFCSLCSLLSGIVFFFFFSELRPHSPASSFLFFFFLCLVPKLSA